MTDQPLAADEPLRVQGFANALPLVELVGRDGADVAVPSSSEIAAAR